MKTPHTWGKYDCELTMLEMLQGNSDANQDTETVNLTEDE